MFDKLLTYYLKPLQPWLENSDVTEIIINRPQEIFIEQSQGMFCHALPELTQIHLQALISNLARQADCHVSSTHPLLATTLPSGHRVQVVIPPACEIQQIGMVIRRIGIQQIDLQTLEQGRCFQDVSVCIQQREKTKPSALQKNELAHVLQRGAYVEFLQQAIQQKKNIIIAGATGSGKTTVLNACLQTIPRHERIITLEDVREIKLPHTNVIHLLARQASAQSGVLSMQDLLHTSLRLRPDRIIMGELRGAEAWDFCHLAASGHPGTLATVHANTAEFALHRLLQLIQLNPHHALNAKEIITQVQSLIDIVVYIQRDWDGEQYQRRVAEILYLK